jgi:hypothetical protein
VALTGASQSVGDIYLAEAGGKRLTKYTHKH